MQGDGSGLVCKIKIKLSYRVQGFVVYFYYSHWRNRFEMHFFGTVEIYDKVPTDETRHNKIGAGKC
jgi:hypothetical protein